MKHHGPAFPSELTLTAMSLGAGAIAGAASVVVSQPIDVVKSNMQGLHGSAYSSALHCARGIFQEHGLQGLYRVCPVLT